jgi:flagellar biosynthesis/type III secretory pathway ATPase
MGAYKKSEILLKVGEYKAGSDSLVDEAIAKWPAINQFLCQQQEDFTQLPDTQTALTNLAT